MIGKASDGDIIKVADDGIYNGGGNEVVFINKGITLSGGWDKNFVIRSETLPFMAEE